MTDFLTGKSRGFTRRSFIAGAATLTAAGALAGCSAATDTLAEGVADPSKAGTEEIFAGVCRGNCSGGCFLNVHVRDGQVVRTSARDMPNPEYNRICSKGLTHAGRIYGANRVLYPMKRVGERGSNDFERISWDEALDTIAEKWTAYREEFGPESIHFLTGSGNYASASGTWGGPSTGTIPVGYQRFVNALGCCYGGTDVDAAIGFGSSRATGGIGTVNELTDRKNTKTQIFWGYNPAISNIHSTHFYLEAKQNDTRLIVIDPVYNANAAKADWWIPVKAGTDGALAFGVLNVMIENGWISDEMLRRTNGDLLIKEDGLFLRMSDLGVSPVEGKVDPKTGKPKMVDPPAVWDETVGRAVPFNEAGSPALEGVSEVNGFKVRTVYEDVVGRVVEYPPSKVAELCGLAEEDVRELARVYHEDGPVATEVMMGMNHYRNGHYSSWLVHLVALLSGNVGIVGGGIGSPGEASIQLAFPNLQDSIFPVDAEGNPCPGQGACLRMVQLESVLDSGRFMGKDLPLKALYVHCGNPVATMTNHEYTMRWFSKFEFVVVADMCMTETCKYADIVLPSAHWFEQVDMGVICASHPYLLWQDKCIEPLGEAKPDFDIFGEILERMGLGAYWGLTSEEFIASLLDSDGWRSVGVTYEDLKESKAARIYPAGDKIASTAAFGTETGRIGLYQENVAPNYDAGQEVDPTIEFGLHWETPTFMGEDREYRKKYPFHLISEHMRTHTHTQWWDCGYVREWEPEPIVRFNPDDAKELGIFDGDTVKLHNDLGFVVMKATISAGIPRGTVTSARSWQQEDFIDGHFASLSSHEYNQVCANQTFNDVAVKIEKM